MSFLNVNLNKCNQCGICASVCPAQALDNPKAPLQNQKKLDHFPVLSSGQAEEFLRSRRSIRVYEDKKIPNNTLSKLLDMGRFAETGGNSQSVSYLVVSKKEILQQLSEMTLTWMEQEIEKGTGWVQLYKGFVKNCRTTGEDLILRGVPHLIFGKAQKAFPLGRENTVLSFSYIELYATSLGLGTCWAGFVENAGRSGYEPMRKILGMDENEVLTGALMAGFPKYRYHRLPDRNPLSIRWID
ncbi:MAG TPA: ferredoxin [Spirochaetia bacterium]|nr:MAG: hypothetical protein A2Y41_05490 [Spirochaetes bacterium GWB1_36_13]HCL55568.1 ferredoxin [Spirochaetia bacterium]